MKNVVYQVIGISSMIYGEHPTMELAENDALTMWVGENVYIRTLYLEDI